MKTENNSVSEFSPELNQVSTVELVKNEGSKKRKKQKRLASTNRLCVRLFYCQTLQLAKKKKE